MVTRNGSVGIRNESLVHLIMSQVQKSKFEEAEAEVKCPRSNKSKVLREFYVRWKGSISVSVSP